MKLKKERQLTIKMLVLGEKQSGKSSLILNYSENGKKTITIAGTKINIEIFERQEAMHTKLHGAMAIIITLDLSHPDSLKSLRNWLGFIGQYASDETQVAVVGTKKDAEGSMQPEMIAPHLLYKRGNPAHVRYFETSANENSGISEAFEELARDVLNKIDPIRTSLAEQLSAFIAQMEKIKLSTNGLYDAGFLFFPPNKSKGIALQTDHLLAIKLLEELLSKKQTISDLFSDPTIRTLQRNIIKDNNLFEKKDYHPNSKICNDLQFIINCAVVEAAPIQAAAAAP